MTMLVKKLSPNAILPSKREEDSGYDIYACIPQHIILKPHEIQFIPTGIAIEIPQGYCLRLGERGSTGSKGIAVRCGWVDSSFRGQVFVVANNTTNKPIFIGTPEEFSRYLRFKPFSKYRYTFYDRRKAIAQGILLKTEHFKVKEAFVLSTSERGEGALGSTNK